MPTTWTSGRFAGALTVIGALTAGVVAITTLTVTTGTFTTVNTQTLSGSTVRAKTATAATLVIGGAGDKKNQAVCYGTGGALGYCTNAVSATGVCSCTTP